MSDAIQNRIDDLMFAMSQSEADEFSSHVTHGEDEAAIAMVVRHVGFTSGTAKAIIVELRRQDREDAEKLPRFVGTQWIWEEAMRLRLDGSALVYGKGKGEDVGLAITRAGGPAPFGRVMCFGLVWRQAEVEAWLSGLVSAKEPKTKARVK